MSFSVGFLYCLH